MPNSSSFSNGFKRCIVRKSLDEVARKHKNYSNHKRDERTGCHCIEEVSEKIGVSDESANGNNSNNN